MKISLWVYMWLLALVACSRGGPSAPAPAKLPTRLPPVAAADTVRTNLWLVRALLGEVVRVGAAAVPADTAAVTVRPLTKHDANVLFTAAAHDILEAAGHEVYLDESALPVTTQPGAPSGSAQAGAAQAAADSITTSGAPKRRGYVLGYRLEEVSLRYPDCGRRFGLWRQWVDRDFKVVALVSVADAASGRLFFDERIARSYADRVPAASFDAVRSSAYGFTDAVLGESGWRRHFEQAVVLGTLAGLVAVYFANTGS